MYGIFNLLILSIVMGLSTYLFGLWGLYLKEFKERISPTNDIDLWILKFSKLSHGMLLGTAFLIIIPEGIHSFIEWDDDYPVVVGICLLLGFLTMILIDNLKIFQLSRTDTNGSSNDYDEEIERLIQENAQVIRDDLTEEIPYVSDTAIKIFLPNVKPVWQKYRKLIISETFLIGLIIHSISDGLAFASGYLTENTKLQTTIFFAIICHKFPTSFSFGIILLQKYQEFFNQNNTETIYKNLLMIIQTELFFFAISSPLTAIITYSLVTLFIKKLEFLTTILLLYSGGSFLYVTVHLLNHHDDGKLTVKNKQDLVIINIIGMFIPLMITLFTNDD